MIVSRVGTMGERIIQVKRILNFAKSIPAGERMTVKQIYDKLKNQVTNEAQVGSTLSYYCKKGYLSRMREGVMHYYWGKNVVAASNASPAGLSPEAKIEPIGPTHELKPIQTARPEIRVEKDRIIIEHAKCRIIVELL